MGQYHIPVNLTKREFISPHALGDGLKALEQAFHTKMGGTLSALHVLLMGSHEARGGGDYRNGIESKYDPDATPSFTQERTDLADVAEMVIGRWGGDNVVIVGDYAQPGDIKHEFPIEHAYALCSPKNEVEETIAYLRENSRDAEADVLQQQIDQHGVFTDITRLVRTYFDDAFGITYSGDGWADRSEPTRG